MKFCSNEPSEAPCKSRRARLYVPGTRYGGNIITPCEIPEMLLGEKRGSLFFDLAQRLLHGFLEIFVLGTAGEKITGDRNNQNVLAVACLLENLYPYDILELDCALFRSGCDALEFDLPEGVANQLDGLSTS